ncbi:hypothetical protein [Streptomyces sp. NPDC003832]
MAAAALLLSGCGSGDDDKAAKSKTPAPSKSAAVSAAASAPASGEEAAPPTTPFKADPAKVPRTRSRAEQLANTVVLQPRAWGADFRAQQQAASTPGTVAVLDEECRWERQPLPRTVLASRSRYSELPATGGKGELKVTAAVTVHASVRDADEHLASTLEEPMRCRRQQVRSDETITELQSAATPFGQGNNTYADDQVVEIGTYLAGKSERTYLWYVTRVGTVTLGVSVKGAEGYTNNELSTFASTANVTMINSVEYLLGKDS